MKIKKKSDFPNEQPIRSSGLMPPAMITPEIVDFCRSINPRAKPTYIVPTGERRFLDCHTNVRALIKERGGEMLPGWMIQQMGLSAFLEAIYHSIWVSPNGEWVDPTPCIIRHKRNADDSNTLVLAEPGTGTILFLPDPEYSTEEARALQAGMILPPRQIPSIYSRPNEAIFQCSEELHAGRKWADVFAPARPCPCKSGKVFKDCCRSHIAAHILASKTRP